MPLRISNCCITWYHIWLEEYRISLGYIVQLWIYLILQYLLCVKMFICERLTDICTPKCRYVYHVNYITHKSCRTVYLHNHISHTVTSQRVIIITNRYWSRFTISQLLSEFIQVQHKCYKILYLWHILIDILVWYMYSNLF